jgi:tRNA(fMet)-specific endonuclease VapC
MRRYLLDTNAMGDLINRRRGVDERAREARRGGAVLGTSVPVLGELFFGIEYSQYRERNLERLKRALTGLVSWPYTREAAEVYGRLAAELKRRGRTIQQVDLQVAATAISLGRCTVVSEDSDLAEVPGLSVESWAGERGGTASPRPL